KHDIALVLRELVPRRVEIEIVSLRQAGEDLHVIRRRRVGLGPGDHGALLEGKRLVRDDELGIEQLLFTQAVARGAGALRGVEREQARLDLLDREAGDGAGELLAEDDAVGGEASALDAGGLSPLSVRLERSREAVRRCLDFA